jgi:O-antigen ligase
MSFLLPVLTIIAIWIEGGVKSISLRRVPPLIFFLLLLIWIGLSIFWAENQIAALKAFITLSLTFVFALFFFSCTLQATPNLISKAYTIIKFTGFFLIFFIVLQVCFDTFLREFITYKGSSYMLRMKPVGSILGLTTFVGCAFLWTYKNKALSIFIFILLCNLIILTRCQTATYGIVLASIVFCLSYMMPFWITRIGMIFSYTFSLLSPLLYSYVFPSSMVAEFASLKWIVNQSFFHRWLAWEHYAKKFFEKPFFGWGVESSRYLYSPTQVNLAPGFTKLIHPHNNSIQTYVELGVVGGVLYSLFFASLFYLVEKRIKDRLSVAVCNATITFGFVGAEITHNAWRNYWLSLAILTGGLIVLFIKAREAQLLAPTGHLTQPLNL